MRDPSITARLIQMLEEDGYIVRHPEQVNHRLSWSRTQPIPSRVDFKSEALDKIREQLEVGHLRFEDRETPGWANDKSITISSAKLFIL